MKRVLTTLFFSGLSIASYANNQCATDNPYFKQTCEQLKQSAESAQKARDEAYQKEIAQSKETLSKRLAEEDKPPPPPPPPVAEWQKALKPVESAQKPPSAIETPSKEAVTTTPPSAALPQSPAEFAPPPSITLPGGVNMIPVKPEKKSGAIKYY